MNQAKVALLTCILALVGALPLEAQTERGPLIEEARQEFDDAAALNLYIAAMDPALGEPDSLWAVAGFDLADRLLLMDREALADVWLRWLARHGSQWPIDRTWYLPTLVEAYEEAVESVQAGESDPVVTPTWRWPDAFNEEAGGAVEMVAPSPAGSGSIAVEGQEDVEPAESLTLSPGTYTLRLSAQDYEPARVTLEVLPGVTTVLEADLAPLLPEDARDRATRRLAQIVYTAGGAEICRNGVLAGGPGLILTPSRLLPSGVSIRVTTFGPEGPFLDVPVLTSDSATGLAALQAQVERTQLPSTPPTVRAGAWVWAVHAPGCAPVATIRTRLAHWPEEAGAPGVLETPVPLEAMGAPLVDRSGTVLALVQDTMTVVPIRGTQSVLAQATRTLEARARAQAAEEASQSLSAPPTRGGFPWKWVGAGLGVAGLAVALTQGGGSGGDGGGGGGGEPTTGGIVITFPGGG